MLRLSVGLAVFKEICSYKILAQFKAVMFLFKCFNVEYFHPIRDSQNINLCREW